MSAREKNEEAGEAESPSPLDHHRGRREEVIPLGRGEPPPPEDAPPDGD